jgi:MSHA biogenesis protein MshL
VPLVGQLFKRTQRTLQKRELVFLLKPTVIRNDAAWSADLSSTRDRLRGLAGGTRPGGPAPGAAKE